MHVIRLGTALSFLKVFSAGVFKTQGDDGYGEGDDDGEDESSETTGDNESTTSGQDPLLPHLDSLQDVENVPAFVRRRTRLREAGEAVGAHLVSFSLEYDARRDPPLKDACPHKLFFRIEGASSNCVRNAWKRAGFERTSKGGWNLWWGRPLKFPEHKKLNEYQKVCHFPGTYYLGRKDNLSRNVGKFKRKNGAGSYPYLPVTYVLPDDHSRLIQDWKDRGEKGLYIVKPKAAARGVGIRLVAKPDVEIKKNANVLVQRYIDRPLLIDDRKFDLRVYVLVTCFDPLRVYVFKEGLARFCSELYSEGGARKNYKDKLRHLTNYSLNKKSGSVEDEGDGAGIKWSFSFLKERMVEMGIDPGPVFARINDLVIRTVISVEEKINANMNMYVPHKANCFELFGFDVMIDRDLHPWIIEVNTSPSLATEWRLDKKIKNALTVDMFNMLGVCGYSRPGMKARRDTPKDVSKAGADRMRKMEVATGRKDALDNLSEGDAAELLEWEAENELRGSFERVFPAPGAEAYLPMFPSQRFNNVLYCAWASCPSSQRPNLDRIACGGRLRAASSAGAPRARDLHGAAGGYLELLRFKTAGAGVPRAEEVVASARKGSGSKAKGGKAKRGTSKVKKFATAAGVASVFEALLVKEPMHTGAGEGEAAKGTASERALAAGARLEEKMVDCFARQRRAVALH